MRLYPPVHSVSRIRGLAWIVAVAWMSMAPGVNAGIIDLKAGEVPFSVIGPLPKSPAPTVFVFALDRKTSLEKTSFNRSAMILHGSRGFLCVSLDMPAHGEDVRPGERGGLPGWKTRLLASENIVAEFAKRFEQVREYLVREGYTDPNRVAVIGISRGGFMGLHLLAANPGIAAVAAIAPAMDLSKVKGAEGFEGLEQHAFTQSLALGRLAAKPNLQKPIWITVGNFDTKVQTALCLDFARDVAAAAPEGTKLRLIELHVVPGDDHRQPAGSHEKAAAWLGEQLASGPKAAPSPQGS